eukprot:15443530-Alexandrium_andersonii.AAC.1
MCTKVANTAVEFFVLSMHDPHAGARPSEVAAWWVEVANQLHASQVAISRLVVCVDANAMLGSFTAAEVGSAGAADENRGGVAFGEFLEVAG